MRPIASYRLETERPLEQTLAIVHFTAVFKAPEGWTLVSCFRNSLQFVASKMPQDEARGDPLGACSIGEAIFYDPARDDDIQSQAPGGNQAWW